MKNQIGKSFVKILALALGIACTHSAAAQSFKRVTVKGGAYLVQIAAGGTSVWARAANGKPYILQDSQFVLANGIALSQIAVGGGNKVQADAVWGLNSAGSIYHATRSGTTWIFSKVPGVLDFIAVGPGYNDNCHPYEVWGLNPSSEIYRYNFCIHNWENIPGALTTLAVGGGEIWGINGNGTAFRFSFTTLLFDQSFADNLVQITVGPNGVWAIALNISQLCQFDVPSQLFRGLTAYQIQTIQAGGNGVWGIDSSQQVFRLGPTAGYNFFPGTGLISISVGSGGGVWGINRAGQPYKFTTP